MRSATNTRRSAQVLVTMALVMTLGQWVLMLFALELLDRLLISGGVAPARRQDSNATREQ